MNTLCKMSDTCTDSLVTNQPHAYSSHLPWNEELRGSLLCRGNITPQVIERLEMELDFYESVSLVFLLYPNVDTALQFLRVAASAERNGSQRRMGLLSEWSRSQTDDSIPWEAAFLEALCIIQNFKIVENLGYQKTDVTERYLPGNPDIALNVDLMRKALYVMCEKLTLEQSRRLINLVSQDLTTEFPSLNSHETEYLEMHILYWLSQKHVVINQRDVDLKNITKHLKVMEEFHLVEYLESIAKRYVTYNDADDETDPDHSVVSTSEMHHKMVQPSTDRYYIDPKNVGFCVIINQKNFYEETNPTLKPFVAPEALEVRTGTDKDRDCLIEAFGNLGFKVHLSSNLTHIDLINTIKSSIQELVEYCHSCFVLCILSHGIRNAVYGTNSIAVSVDDIEGLLHHCPKLLGKPKLLIIQACQGHNRQDALPYSVPSVKSDIATDGPTQSQQTRPQICDMLTLWSTVPGYASFRDRVKGSWFIQTLCDHLLEPTVEVDIFDIAREVNNSIQCMMAKVRDGDKAMQPVAITTMGKKLILPCSREARKTVAERMAMRHLFDVMLDEYLRRDFRQLPSLSGGCQ